MESTMMRGDMSIRGILEYGMRNFSESKVVSYYGEFSLEHSFFEVGRRAAQLAHSLEGLGVAQGDRVATFCMNHNNHLEAYFAVPSMGAVLHTLNVRLFPDQLRYVIEDASDKVIIVDNVLISMLVQVLSHARSVKYLAVVGPLIDPSVKDELATVAPWLEVVDYEELIAQEPETYDWPDLVETSAAAMCYTSGTTGNPKGVVYSHRSIVTHAMMAVPLYDRAAFDLTEPKQDRALIIVPMFHANSWGAPHACWLTGADMIMPTRFLQAAPLADMIEKYRPTVSLGVPTIWNDLFHYLADHPVDMSSFRWIISGGSATPRALIQGFLDRYNVAVMSGWGMTETSPVCTIALAPPGTPREKLVDYFETAGRVVAGVELRIYSEEAGVCPNDGATVGEVQVRGPWIAGSYFNGGSKESFVDGWLRTGDMGTLDRQGYLRIVDRTKDMIKSGGEWISSIELENALMAHPDVLEAAVIGVADEKWFERPLAFVVLRQGADVTALELREFLNSAVAKWWLPERFCFVQELPKTSVGKFDKKVMRQQVREGALKVVHYQESEVR